MIPIDFFGPDGPRYCRPESLRGHIVNAHFQARTLASMGIARFDIELAQKRGIGLQWVVKQALLRIERSDKEILQEICDHDATDFTQSMYRTVLAKNLKYIEELDLAQVDWSRVERHIPQIAQLQLDINKDSYEGPFAILHPNYDRPQSIPEETGQLITRTLNQIDIAQIQHPSVKKLRLAYSDNIFDELPKPPIVLPKSYL